MFGIPLCRAMGIAVLVGFGALSSNLDASDSYDSTIAAALKLLPDRPVRVVVIDADEATPEVRQRLVTLDAFITKGSSVVYLTKQSQILQGAQKGSQVHRYMLASVIWHEMAHIAGADEAKAQQREEQLWTRFLLDGNLDRLTALRYLALMQTRHAGQAQSR